MPEGTVTEATAPPVSAPEQPSTPPVAQSATATTPAAPEPPPFTMHGFLKDRMPEAASLTETQLQQAGAAALLRYREAEAEIARLKAAQRPPEPPKTPDAPWWEQKVEYDPAWRVHAEFDPQTNTYKPLAGRSPEYADKLNRYEQTRQERARKLLESPAELLEPLVKHILSQQMQTLTASQQMAREAENFLANNTSWLVEHVNGQPMYLGNQPQLSKVGEQFFAHVANAERLGITNRHAQLKYAYGEIAAAGLLPAKSPLGNLPAPTNPDDLAAKRRQHELAEVGQRPGAVTPGQNGGLTYEQRVARMAQTISPNETLIDFWKRSNS